MKSAVNEVQNSLSTALASQDIRETCRKLTQLIDECGTHHYGAIFQKIMEDIFTIRSYKWSLTKSGTLMDSMCVREFLGVNGPMFRLVNRMQQHGMQCQGPEVPRSTIYSDSYDTFRSLTAFEAYFSHFAVFIKKPSFMSKFETTQIQNPGRFGLNSAYMAPTDSEDMTYFVLLDEYLAYYFPTTPDIKPPKITLSASAPFRVAPRPYHSVARSSYLLRHDSVTSPSSNLASYGETWCCDILTGIFSNFWLEDYKPKSSQISNETTSFSLPTENHVRSVRILVKYVHYFCNAFMENTLSKRFQNDSLLEQVNQSVLNKFQPKLFLFLSCCFESWPLDHTFRIVLETWLSYIQPWRYVKTVTDARNDPNGVSNDWFHFVFTNLKFYTSLFQYTIRRFLRMDISTTGNSLLLFRVAKIFSQTNLITLIDQAEDTNPTLGGMSHNYNSYIGQSYNLSAADSKDDDMFSPAFTDVMRQLLLIISQALETLRSSSADANSNWSNKAVGFFGYGALLDDKTSYLASMPDKKKTEQNLNYAMRVFADIYELPIPKMSNERTRGSLSKNLDDIADHIIDNDGSISLSPTGRYQLKNNLKKFPIVPRTEPDLRPICSYENAFLVRLMYSVSKRFNDKYQGDIETLCEKKDILGKVCRIIFTSHDGSPKIAGVSHPKPHLSLRFVGHYRTIFYMAVLYVLSRLFGFNFFFVIFYILLLVVIAVFFKALFSRE